MANAINNTVVAFSVKVKLVDSIVNSHAGRVNVVKVMSQNSIVGIALMMNSNRPVSRSDKLVGAGCCNKTGDVVETPDATAAAADDKVVVDDMIASLMLSATDNGVAIVAILMDCQNNYSITDCSCDK